MPVRLVPCRHKDTGVEADLPETVLRYGLMPAYEPVDDADRARIDEVKAADKAAAEKAAADLADNAATPPADPTPTPDPDTGTDKSKPATGAASKKTKE